MTGIGPRSGIAMLAAIALMVASGAALAQTRVPTREGNIWDWRDHEPVPSQIHRAEQANGIASSPEHRQTTTDEVEDLYRSLMRGEPTPPR